MTRPSKRISLPRNGKPDKPYRDFPLYAHASRRWAKKVRGVTRFFGPWDDPDGALNKWLDQRDDLLAGREPRATGDGLTIRTLVNLFLESKEALRDTGELAPRSFADYLVTCKRIVKVFGRGRLVSDLRPTDFEKLRKDYAKTHGPTSLANDIGHARVVFNYAYKQGLIERPLLFGDGFKKPKAAVLRRERQKKGVKMFTPQQIQAMLVKARPQLKAMILLGINCGMGNTDCAMLPLTALDLQTGWLTYPRIKTAIERRAKLWPETVAALKDVLDHRRESKDADHADKVFVTKCGFPWLGKCKTDHDCPVSKETTKLLKALGIHRRGLGFYALRNTFETVGGESLDQAAVDRVMGHVSPTNDMSAVYRQRITDERLLRVAKYVRRWLLKSRSSWKRLPFVA